MAMTMQQAPLLCTMPPVTCMNREGAAHKLVQILMKQHNSEHPLLQQHTWQQCLKERQQQVLLMMMAQGVPLATTLQGWAAQLGQAAQV
jgi:hypothetical protein